MSRIKEEDIVIPALKYVNDHPNCTTENIKYYLENLVSLSPDDEEILSGRNDTKFSQIVRNLISHYDNNKFGKYTNRTKVDRIYKFTINSAGVIFLSEINQEDIQDLMETDINNEKILVETEYNIPSDLDNANNRMPVPGSGSSSKRYKTDNRIAKTALVKCNYLCEYGTLIGQNHITFDAKNGNKYLEAHHLIPMKAQKDFLPNNLDRIENIVGLCPMCHAAVHHGTSEEKTKILKELYASRINALKECDQNIEIDFTELMLKYYL